ncbi:hypothetical protein [Croceitalea dokdonensis]|uniref:hypothetical protein n=1 Tax=Croceitalea dokdonensis TaxID=346188 RepID=UPI0006CA57DC|nr:hypothetical protein [Croceitalea dokdonensis]
MVKKIGILVTLFVFCQTGLAQELRLKKGVFNEIEVQTDTITERISIFLPTIFDSKGKWPLLLVIDLDGNQNRYMSLFKEVAEDKGYILAAPLGVADSLALSKNMVVAQRSINRLREVLPVHNERIYTAGFRNSGRFANLVPIFIKDVAGVVSVGASLVNIELLASKNPFYFIGIVGTSDFTYPSLLQDEQVLNKLKFPNHLLVHDGDNELPTTKYLRRALNLFELSSMAKGFIPKDSALIQSLFKEDLAENVKYQSQQEWLLADRSLRETITAFRTLKDVDSLRRVQKELRRSKLYKTQYRSRTATLFNEQLKRDEYNYYLEDDVVTYNFNNLGWWKYQMTQLNAKVNAAKKEDRKMGLRLIGYINALIDDNITLVKADKVVDEEALVLLYMLKTITAPEELVHYKNVISIAAKNLDYGTALFYAEELLKQGYKDKDAMYTIDYTHLFKITPEYNALIEKYLGEPRYKVTREEEPEPAAVIKE